ncbi:MAG: hypothetical protein R2681_10740 [Pyrinomonadaceae bacterium]
MKDMLYAVLALVSVIAAGFFFYTYVSQGEAETSKLPFFGAIACTLIALILGALFLSGRVNKTEDIHITE